MLSFIVRMRFGPEDHEQVREHMRALTQGSRQEPGCISYIAHFVEDDASTTLIYEQYTDQAALEAHRATPHFHEHSIGGLLQLMKERSIENLSAIC
ncbi:MAG: putative quinol monooxygenase [Granulicella sp.]